MNHTSLNVRIFADGADLPSMLSLEKDPLISGFTTNPTLMRKAGIADFMGFANEVLAAIVDKPISFEVVSDDLAEMERQAQAISALADNVYVKIPVTDTRGHSTAKLVASLSADGVKVNVTAVMTPSQVRSAAEALESSPGGIISVFAGRIADTGRDPVPIVSAALALVEHLPSVSLLWASPREVLNVVQADRIGCHIITLTTDLLQKVRSLGRDLNEVSLDTVKMFHTDASKAGYDF